MPGFETLDFLNLLYRPSIRIFFSLIHFLSMILITIDYQYELGINRRINRIDFRHIN